MNVVDMRAFQYAEDMVNYILDQHKIKWRLKVGRPLALRVLTYPRFHFNVGKVIVSFAKGSEKKNLLETGSFLLKKVTSYEEFDRFVRCFSTLYFDRYDCNATAMFVVFAYIIEYSILYHLQKPNMPEAPEIARSVIAEILTKTDKETFIETGGLLCLNTAAKSMLEEPSSIVKDLYLFQKFAW